MGLPAVVVATEQFEKLARKILQSQNVPESVMVVLRCNPEFISEAELGKVAERMLEETVARLTQARAGRAS